MNIIRNDRGIDFRTLSKLADNFKNSVDKTTRAILKGSSLKKDEVKKEAYSHFGIEKDFAVIKELDNKIKELESQKKVYEGNIRKYTQVEGHYYNSFDYIHDNSPIDKYIKEHTVDESEVREKLYGLCENLNNEIFLCKDIEQVIELVEKYNTLLKEKEAAYTKPVAKASVEM